MILYSLASDTVCEVLLYEVVTKGLGDVNHSASLQWAKFAVQNCYMFQWQEYLIRSEKSVCGREASPNSVCMCNMKKEAILQCSCS